MCKNLSRELNLSKENKYLLLDLIDTSSFKKCSHFNRDYLILEKYRLLDYIKGNIRFNYYETPLLLLYNKENAYLFKKHLSRYMTNILYSKLLKIIRNEVSGWDIDILDKEDYINHEQQIDASLVCMHTNLYTPVFHLIEDDKSYLIKPLYEFDEKVVNKNLILLTGTGIKRLDLTSQKLGVMLPEDTTLEKFRVFGDELKLYDYKDCEYDKFFDDCEDIESENFVIVLEKIERDINNLFNDL